MLQVQTVWEGLGCRWVQTRGGTCPVVLIISHGEMCKWFQGTRDASVAGRLEDL